MTIGPVRKESLLAYVGGHRVLQMRTPTLRPLALASGELPTAADQGTPNGQLGNGALFTLDPKLNNDGDNTVVTTLTCIAVFTCLWYSALYTLWHSALYIFQIMTG